jgi:heme oxygenase
MPLNPAGVLAQLRASTRAEHERIEQLLRLTEPMDLARYARVIAGFDEFLAAWEPRLQAALPERLQPWFGQRLRRPLARADRDWLHAVAALPPSRAAVAASVVASLPLDDLAQGFGSMYVIEGSSLGGRVIAPHLQATLGLEAGRGASYFHGFGVDAAPMWSDFRAVAALEIGDAAPAVARACTSARRTFEALIETFGTVD